jgi:hypothetical protein
MKSPETNCNAFVIFSAVISDMSENIPPIRSSAAVIIKITAATIAKRRSNSGIRSSSSISSSSFTS